MWIDIVFQGQLFACIIHRKRLCVVPPKFICVYSRIAQQALNETNCQICLNPFQQELWM